MGARRHDYRDPIRTKPGKRTVSYPYGDTSYPRIVESGSASKTSADGSTPFGQAHPERAAYPNAVLIDQQSDKGDDSANNWTLTFERLPGKLIWKPGFNGELGCETSEYRQKVQMPSAEDTIGSTITSPLGVVQIVVDSFIEPIGESGFLGEKVTLCWTSPPSRQEKESIGFEFPAQFDFIGGWLLPSTPGISTPGPYPGVNFNLTGHRTMSAPATVAISYSNGNPGSMPTIWRVVTPGVADRFFGIGPNTIHNAIFLQEVAGVTQTVEDLPASTPSSYSPGATLTVRAGSRLIKGTIWEKRIYTVSE